MKRRGLRGLCDSSPTWAPKPLPWPAASRCSALRRLPPRCLRRAPPLPNQPPALLAVRLLRPLLPLQDVILRGGRALPLYARVCEAEAPMAIVLPAAAGGALQGGPLRPGDLAWEDFLASAPAPGGLRPHVADGYEVRRLSTWMRRLSAWMHMLLCQRVCVREALRLQAPGPARHACCAALRPSRAPVTAACCAERVWCGHLAHLSCSRSRITIVPSVPPFTCTHLCLPLWPWQSMQHGVFTWMPAFTTFLCPYAPSLLPIPHACSSAGHQHPLLLGHHRWVARTGRAGCGRPTIKTLASGWPEPCAEFPTLPPSLPPSSLPCGFLAPCACSAGAMAPLGPDPSHLPSPAQPQPAGQPIDR